MVRAEVEVFQACITVVELRFAARYARELRRAGYISYHSVLG
jgi:hypothetical protein